MNSVLRFGIGLLLVATSIWLASSTYKYNSEIKGLDRKDYAISLYLLIFALLILFGVINVTDLLD